MIRDQKSTLFPELFPELCSMYLTRPKKAKTKKKDVKIIPTKACSAVFSVAPTEASTPIIIGTSKEPHMPIIDTCAIRRHEDVFMYRTI